MSKKSVLFGISLAVGFAFMQPAVATTINLIPSSTSVALGSTVQVAISADIDTADAIIGFGFDLSLNPGGVFNFLGFTPGAQFADDPINLAPLSDSDGIRGASNGDLFTGPAISGNGILLGTLNLQAIGIETGILSLGADDLNFFYTEGLIPEDLGRVNFLPPVTGASITVTTNNAPEPPFWMLFGVGVAAMVLTSVARQGKFEYRQSRKPTR